MNFIESIKERAKLDKKTIILPESMDSRVIEAASKIIEEDICNIIIIGDKNSIDVPGAMVIDPKNYFFTDELANKLYEQAINLGSEIKFEKVININDGKVKEVITSDNSYECKSIIIATGSENRKLGLDNENKLIGKGISYCATCDGNFFKNMPVAVVGGGKVAIEDAMFLSDICKEVYLIHRRSILNDDISKLSIDSSY